MPQPNTRVSDRARILLRLSPAKRWGVAVNAYDVVFHFLYHPWQSRGECELCSRQTNGGHVHIKRISEDKEGEAKN
jgi:hypothetical protein